MEPQPQSITDWCLLRMPAVSPNVRRFNPLIIDDSCSNWYSKPPAMITRDTILTPLGKSCNYPAKEKGGIGRVLYWNPHGHWLSGTWLHRPHMGPINSVFLCHMAQTMLFNLSTNLWCELQLITLLFQLWVFNAAKSTAWLVGLNPAPPLNQQHEF
jgi:hypothetical protein